MGRPLVAAADAPPRTRRDPGLPVAVGRRIVHAHGEPARNRSARAREGYRDRSKRPPTRPEQPANSSVNVAITSPRHTRRTLDPATADRPHHLRKLLGPHPPAGKCV
jgi:hypothetical protein